MNEVAHVNGTSAAVRLLRRGMFCLRGSGRPNWAAVPGDQADVLELDRVMGGPDRIPAPRYELVKRIRAEIEGGTYETRQRINATIDILLDELGD